MIGSVIVLTTMPTKDECAFSTYKTNNLGDKFLEEKWITSGSLGSRDSVLVFRHKNLEKKSKDIILSSKKEISDTNKKNAVFNDFVAKDVSGLKLYNNSLPSLDVIRKDNVALPKHVTNFLNMDITTSNMEQSNSYETYQDTNKVYEEDDDEIIMQFSNMPAYKMKIKYKFMQTETKLLRKIFACHGLSEVGENESFSILWTGVHIKPDILRNLAPYQRVNHFPRSYELTRKDRLYKNIEKMQHLRGIKNFDIVPQSFVLPIEYKELVSAHNKNRGPWIVKPAASSRGRGIFIVNTHILLRCEPITTTNGRVFVI
uniref:Tubulin--tyrosine ligase-like protein 5 n=2 Tax=Bactrocera latifrons TaxID=174628 RepID=A0A0K8UL06_BACLA